MDTILKFDWMLGDRLISEVTIDFPNKEFRVTNHSNHPAEIFYYEKSGSIEALYELLETRCYDRNYQNIKEVLKVLNLVQYDPLEICKITCGRLWYDDFHMVWK